MNLFYIVKCTTTALGGGILGLQYCGNEVKQVNFTPCESPSYLQYSHDHKYLFVACENKAGGGVISFRVKEDGALEPNGQQLQPGYSVCYVDSDPDGKFLYAANYGKGRIDIYPLEDGKPGPFLRSIQHTGSGPNPKRQESAHVHFTHLTPDGKYLAVVDLGLDSLFCYPLCPKNGLDEANVKVTKVLPAGSGPRHIVFSKDGKRAWLLNELANTVISMNYNDGTFELVQTLPMIPAPFHDFSKAAAIRLSPDEQFLYASNRGYDTVAVYRILPGNLLASAGSYFVGAKSLRDVNFLPGGTKFAAGGELSDDVFFFDYDPKTGALQPDGNTLTGVTRAICILNE